MGALYFGKLLFFFQEWPAPPKAVSICNYLPAEEIETYPEDDDKRRSKDDERYTSLHLIRLLTLFSLHVVRRYDAICGPTRLSVCAPTCTQFLMGGSIFPPTVMLYFQRATRFHGLEPTHQSYSAPSLYSGALFWRNREDNKQDQGIFIPPTHSFNSKIYHP